MQKGIFLLKLLENSCLLTVPAVAAIVVVVAPAVLLIAAVATALAANAATTVLAVAPLANASFPV